MRIRLAFTDDDCAPDQMPYLVSAVDEYTEDEWNGVPDFHVTALNGYKRVREATIVVSDDAVAALFRVPGLAAKLEGEP